MSGSRARTTIIVAHRLSTVKNVDRVIVMDHGRVVEQGKPHDLLHTGMCACSSQGNALCAS